MMFNRCKVFFTIINNYIIIWFSTYKYERILIKVLNYKEGYAMIALSNREEALYESRKKKGLV